MEDLIVHDNVQLLVANIYDLIKATLDTLENIWLLLEYLPPAPVETDTIRTIRNEMAKTVKVTLATREVCQKIITKGVQIYKGAQFLDTLIGRAHTNEQHQVIEDLLVKVNQPLESVQSLANSLDNVGEVPFGVLKSCSIEYLKQGSARFEQLLDQQKSRTWETVVNEAAKRLSKYYTKLLDSYEKLPKLQARVLESQICAEPDNGDSYLQNFKEALTRHSEEVHSLVKLFPREQIKDYARSVSFLLLSYERSTTESVEVQFSKAQKQVKSHKAKQGNKETVEDLNPSSNPAPKSGLSKLQERQTELKEHIANTEKLAAELRPKIGADVELILKQIGIAKDGEKELASVCNDLGGAKNNFTLTLKILQCIEHLMHQSSNQKKGISAVLKDALLRITQSINRQISNWKVKQYDELTPLAAPFKVLHEEINPLFTRTWHP